MQRTGWLLGLAAAAALGACTEETETTGGGGGTPTTTSETTTTTTAQGGDGGGDAGAGGSVGGQGGSGGSAGSGGDDGGSGGQGGVHLAPEDVCDPTPVGEGFFSGDYDHIANDYDPGEVCTGHFEPGPDAAYAISVPAGETLLAVLSPQADGSLYLLTDCATPESTCVAGADDAGTNGEERLEWTNSSGSAALAYLIVDSFVAGTTGSYDLVLNIGGEHTCNDFMDNDVDEAFDCADATACGASADCTPGSGATGSACTLPTDCAAYGADPSCIDWPGWWNGYCSDWCDTSADDCDDGGADALCVDTVHAGYDTYDGDLGLCLDRCAVTADCATDYRCDTLDEGSVCVPELGSCLQAATAQVGTTNGNTTGGPDGRKSSCADWAAEAGFAYTAPADGTLEVTLASATDQGFALYEGDCALAHELACAEDAFGGTDEAATVTVTSGTTYYIVVKAYYGGDEGPFTLELTFTPS